MSLSTTADCLVAAIGDVSAAEIAAFPDKSLLRNFEHFRRFSSPLTELFWVRVSDGPRLIALVPVVRLRKRRATDMLRPSVRRWMGPVVGPFAKKTTLLVDTAFLAYDDASPLHCRDDVEPNHVKTTVSEFLKAQKGVDAVWITEPQSESTWAATHGYQQFFTLPMVHIATGDFTDVEHYAASLSKKRRRNFRRERDTFAAAGGRFELFSNPLADELLESLMTCLQASAAHSQFMVPYNDVLTDPRAFATQEQTVITAAVDGEVVGFMSFIADRERLMQCHGGLDYRRSHDVLAYHNLIYRAIEYAIAEGFQRLSMGPLNNETKRRAGSELKSMVANLWNRNPVDRFAAEKFFAKNFEVYRGQVPRRPGGA